MGSMRNRPIRPLLREIAAIAKRRGHDPPNLVRDALQRYIAEEILKDHWDNERRRTEAETRPVKRC